MGASLLIPVRRRTPAEIALAALREKSPAGVGIESGREGGVGREG